MKGCRPLSDTEVDALLTDLPIRDRLLVLTGLYFGTRVSETLSLTFGDMAHGYLHIRSAKNSNNVALPIPPQYVTEVDALKAHYQAQGIAVNDDTPLFLSRKGEAKPITRQQASHILSAAQRREGLDGTINTHSLRKTFVTRIYELSGRDIAQTKKYSRHKSLANLDYYIGTCENLELVHQLNWCNSANSKA